ncbi:prepilin-type N-terminal cleavage/methylation domain-containing protein [Microbacterium sp. ET2]|uniref:type IV pilus modification PilV family protein n=1 Tax=Microbacterium albipurpureum TaxID=3050384 RepID=UPI00259CC736|nr:prepilin-type N-terminal cleavage/methylation domain-containing protein [Microbacterium sp. ET2 (Ac-2212)]WJL94337.1 prepilin-type N-terminal cleavage/methylation domain-containing protein [Microbacterium sp. ET2 (Ac-2212)]
MRGERDHDLDDGFGLVEVVVAMLLFAVIAMAILPLAIQATKLSAGNRDTVTAQALASGELAALRELFPDHAANSCAAVRGAAGTTAAPAASDLVADLTVATCPATFPSTVTATVAVRDTTVGSTAALVTMATQIVVLAP